MGFIASTATFFITITAFIPNENSNPKWYDLLAYVEPQDKAERQPFLAVVDEFCVEPKINSPFPMGAVFFCTFELDKAPIKNIVREVGDNISDTILKKVGSIEANKVF